MTREEVINIIKQNQDVLTPENYQNILENVDILSDSDKERIVAYLAMAQEMHKVNHEFMEEQNRLNQKTGDKLKVIDEKMKHDFKESLKKAEAEEKKEESDEAENLLSNL